jgi:hypothetical protein
VAIVRKAIFDGKERKRLYKEANEFMSLRAKRKQYIADNKTTPVAQVASE